MSGRMDRGWLSQGVGGWIDKWFDWKCGWAEEQIDG